MNRVFFLVTIFVAMGCIVAKGAEVSLTPLQDNTIFEESSNLSNGSGRYLFAGTTAGREGTTFRRALMAFDVAGNVPDGATITDSELTLNMNKTVSGGHDTSLHRVLRDWGEGGSNASGQEGQGTSAQTGDATWDHASFSSSDWTTPGGDFIDTASDTISVARNGRYTWGSGGTLTSDVQLWLDDPIQNFGWILIGNEPVSRSAKRFDSREAPRAANRPTLTISFDVSLFGDCNGDGVVDAADLACVSTIEERDIVLAAIPTLPGDLDGNGSVEFPDFLTLSAAFGTVVGSYPEGDVNLNGTVDFPDFLVLSANFGGTFAGAAASVPEPSVCFGLFIGLLSLASRRSARSQNCRV